MRAFAACLVLLLAAPAWAAPLVALDDYVVDAAGLMSPERRAALSDRLRAHEAETSNQVTVATVQTLEGRTVEDAALEILRAAGVGQADRDNGVLLLIAAAERRIRIEVGYGLEGALPDALAGRIIAREIAPPFKAGDPAAGIEAGAGAIMAAVAGEYVADGDAADEPPWIPYAMVVAFIVIMVLMRRSNRRRRAALGGLGAGAYAGSGWGRRDGDSFGGGGFGGGGFSGGGGSGGGGGGGASGGW